MPSSTPSRGKSYLSLTGMTAHYVRGCPYQTPSAMPVARHRASPRWGADSMLENARPLRALHVPRLGISPVAGHGGWFTYRWCSTTALQPRSLYTAHELHTPWSPLP